MRRQELRRRLNRPAPTVAPPASPSRFAELAREYELWLNCDPDYMPLQRDLVKEITAYCHSLEGNRVWIHEGGFGTGLTSQLLLEAEDRLFLVGSDPDTIMNCLAEQRLQQQFVGRYFLMDLDFARALKAGAQTFEIITSALTIHNLTPGDRQPLFDQINRHLKSGGLLAIADKIIPDDEAEYETLFAKWIKQLDYFKQIGRNDLYQKWYEHEMVDHENRLTESALTAHLEAAGLTDICYFQRRCLYRVVTAKRPK